MRGRTFFFMGLAVGLCGVPFARKQMIPDSALKAGDTVRWPDLGRQRRLPMPNTRLVTIDVESSRAEPVVSGDRVDVIATMVDPATHQVFAHTLIEYVLVTGMTQRAAMTSVQLLVVPDEAQTLLLAQEAGKLSLSLRSPDDTETRGPTRRTTIADLVQATDGVQRCHYRLPPLP